MLVDPYGRQVAVQAEKLVDHLDGYELPRVPEWQSPELRGALERELAKVQKEAGRLDGLYHLDGFVNELTGIGDFTSDKTFGGRPGGPAFLLHRMAGLDAELRQRGSDLGGNIVEKIPDEMTREGWTVQVQPTEEESSLAPTEQAKKEPARAAAGWRRIGATMDQAGRIRCEAIARRWDEWPTQLGAVKAPPAPPGPLPKLNDEGLELGAAMDAESDRLGVVAAFNQALRYERCFGGAAIFIGADDGEQDLTKPLRADRIREIRHLTPYFGGWDGEVVAWRWYNDPSKPKHGQPEIYQVRNLGVPLARPPAPGETAPPQQSTPPMIWYVHESRFLVFDGSPASRRSQVEMRGWGDSVFTRTNQVLSQYEQSWGGLAVLMQELSITTLSVPQLIENLASQDPKRAGLLAMRARMLQITTAICRARLIDATEKFERVTASLTGAPELMREFALRLAAAVDMPVSLLFGQVKGGLGDAGNTDIRFFYDRIASKQKTRMLPLLRRLYSLMWQAADSPTNGVEPDKWSVVLRPLWQMTAVERADHRLKVTQADQIAIDTSQVTPEEVAATRYGGADFDDGPIVLDMEGRAAMKAIAEEPKPAPPDPGSPPPGSAAPPVSGVGTQPNQPTAIPSMTPVPADPVTADPVAVPSTVGGAAKKPA